MDMYLGKEKWRMYWDKIEQWAGPELLRYMEQMAKKAGMDRDGWKDIPAFRTTVVTAAMIGFANHYCDGPDWDASDIARAFRTLGIEGRAKPAHWLVHFKSFRRSAAIRSEQESQEFLQSLNDKDAEDLRLFKESEAAAEARKKAKPSKHKPLTVAELEGEHHKPRRPRKPKS